MSRSSSERGVWGPCPPPREDELLSSWLARAAAAHGQSVHRFAVDRLGMRTLPRDIDRRPAAGLIDRILAGGRVTPTQLEAMTLRPWEERLGSRAVAAGVTPWLLARGLAARSRFRHGVQACVHCMAEGSGFRRRWRLAFAVVCDHHASWLIDACSACDEPLSAEQATAYGMRCAACHRAYTEHPGQGPFFSHAAQLQVWLLGALESGSSIQLGTVRLSLANALLGFRFLVRLGHRCVGSSRRFGEIERMRHGERVLYMDSLWALLSRWPEGLVDQARQANMSRNPFPGEACPEWVLRPFSILRAPRARRAEPKAEEDAVLEHLRRRRPANWRSRHAHRLARLVGENS